MNFTFDCILIKDNKAVRENLTVPIISLPEEYIKVINYVNNSLLWLKEIGIIGLKNRLLKNPTNSKVYWESIYDNHSSEKNSLIGSLHSYLFFELTSSLYGYQSQYGDNFKKTIILSSDLCEKINRIDSLVELNEDDFDILCNVIYFNCEELLNNVINLHLLDLIIRDLIINKNYLGKIIFVNPKKAGRYDQTYLLNEIKFNWYYYDETRWYHCDDFNIYFLNRSMIQVLEITKNPYTIDIVNKKSKSPFYAIDTINIINEFLSDMDAFKLNFAKSQVRELKRVLKSEEAFVYTLENNILPELLLKKNELSSTLLENKDDSIEKLKKDISEIDSLISKFTSIDSKYDNFKSTAISIYEKTTRINLLKSEINFWIDWIEGDKDLLKRV
jgi:hypothetical protein